METLRGAAQAAAAAVTGAQDPQQALFASLLAADPKAATAAVELTPRSASGQRSLVATRSVEAGASLLTVPKSLLVTAHRSGVIGGLAGQTDCVWDAAGDLRDEVGEELFERGATWDVRLALGVFDACAGAGGPFWDQYRRLLPPPPRVAHPLTLPAALLDELQDDALRERVLALREKLRALYPSLDEHSVHPATASYEAMGAPLEQIPKPLEYTYALVVSRCFAMSDGDTFAFVPFLDMADHDAAPSANFGSDQRGFVLRALRDLDAGDPISICYGEEYTTPRLFEQYGFAPEQGTAQDARWLREIVEAATDADAPGVAQAIADAPATPLGDSQAALQALGAAFSAQSESPLSTQERRAAIFDALLGDEPAEEVGEAATAAAEPVAPAALLAAVRWAIGRLPTTLEEDEAELRELQGMASEGKEAGGGAIDPRVEAVLGYRLARKRQLAITEATLSTFLGV